MTTDVRQVWTPLAIISWGTEYLRTNSIDSPRLTVELLLCHVLQCRRIDLYTQFEKPLTPDELARFKSILLRRLAREPLQYILGKTEFMGLEFTVSPSVFIPRPETERVVEIALECLARRTPSGSPARVLDIGTGSGNIAVSLLHFDRTISCTALDVSPDALAVAAKNAYANSVADRLTLLERDVLTSFPTGSGPYALVVSNPPYIPLDEYVRLQPEITQFEPRTAATDGGDGLGFYRRISASVGDCVTPDGACVVEIAYNQAGDVRALFERTFENVTVTRDYSGHDRVVCAWGRRG